MEEPLASTFRTCKGSFQHTWRCMLTNCGAIKHQVFINIVVFRSRVRRWYKEEDKQFICALMVAVLGTIILVGHAIEFSCYPTSWNDPQQQCQYALSGENPFDTLKLELNATKAEIRRPIENRCNHIVNSGTDAVND